MTIPNFIVAGPGRRATNYKAACIANLRSIEGAKATWAFELYKSTNEVPSDADLFGDDRYLTEKPACPEGGRYTVGAVQYKPECSIRGHAL
jgi:hypothetical protein